MEYVFISKIEKIFFWKAKLNTEVFIYLKWTKRKLFKQRQQAKERTHIISFRPISESLLTKSIDELSMKPVKVFTKTQKW